MDIVDMFRNDATKADFVGRRETPAGPMLFVSRPIRIDDPTCFKCHGMAQNAPPELIKRYGADNGFGWTLGDVVARRSSAFPGRWRRTAPLRHKSRSCSGLPGFSR
jgi:protein-histidine pros-kinase